MKEELIKIFNDIERILNKGEIESIKYSTEKELRSYHFGIGMRIRNEYLWSEQKIYHLFIENGGTHPDDMSYIILKEFCKYLNENN